MKNVIDKARAAGARAGPARRRFMACERGVSFGYNNLVSDMRSPGDHARHRLRRWCSTPRTRVQLPGGQGDQLGGQREFVPVLARAAVAAGVAGLFMETHPDPARGAVRRAQRLAAAAHARTARDIAGNRRRGQAALDSPNSTCRAWRRRGRTNATFEKHRP
jgi:3-deoxy-D-manno-octulosonic acid (KDO) 8-phosphate synthase